MPKVTNSRIEPETGIITYKTTEVGNIVDNFQGNQVIIQGPQGPMGPQGPQGESIQGPPGKPGLDGKQGKSAYQSWLSVGHTGTEEDFVEWNRFNSSDYIPLTEKAMPNGVATLDINGKVPVSQLPDSILGKMEFIGVWDAQRNLPTLPVPHIENKGYYWIVNVAGDTPMSGVSDWKVGDWIVSTGDAYVKIDNQNQVTSVNGKIGNVIIRASDIEGIVTSVNGVRPDATGNVVIAFPPPYILKPATRTNLGGIVVGNGLVVDSNGRVDLDPELALDFRPSNVWFVTENGKADGNGSPNRPFNSINLAINVAQPHDEIYVTAGVYPELVVIDKTLTLRGSPEVKIDEVLLNAADIFVDNVSAKKVRLEGVSGNTQFNDVYINAANASDLAIEVGASSSNSHVMFNNLVVPKGKVVVKENAPHVWFNLNEMSGGAEFEINGGIVTIFDSEKVGNIKHTKGRLNLDDIASVTGLDSTATKFDNAFLFVYKVVFENAMNKTGDCDYAVNLICRAKGHLLNGNDQGMKYVYGEDVKSRYEPVNYTVVSTVLDDHLSGLDKELKAIRDEFAAFEINLTDAVTPVGESIISSANGVLKKIVGGANIDVQGTGKDITISLIKTGLVTSVNGYVPDANGVSTIPNATANEFGLTKPKNGGGLLLSNGELLVDPELYGPNAGFSPAKMIYVSVNGDTFVGNGRRSAPFKTVNEALQVATNGDVIFITAGDYDEHLILGSKSVHIHGVVDGAVKITKGVHFTGESNVYLSNLVLYNNEADDIAAFSTLNMKGRVLSKNITLQGGATSLLMHTKNTIHKDMIGNLEFYNLSLGSGKVLFDVGTGQVNINDCDNTYDPYIEMKGGVVKIDGARYLERVVHEAGYLALRNIGRIGKQDNISGIYSTASNTNSSLHLDYVSTVVNDTYQSFIEKSGDCDYYIGSFTRNLAKDTFNGSEKLIRVNRWDREVGVSYNATNYNGNKGTTLLNHLFGIDTKLGELINNGGSNVTLENTTGVGESIIANVSGILKRVTGTGGAVVTSDATDIIVDVDTSEFVTSVQGEFPDALGNVELPDMTETVKGIASVRNAGGLLVEDGELFVDPSIIGGATTNFSPANTLFVAKNGVALTGDGKRNSPFATIGDAITAAKDGDVIYVSKGEYSENLILGSKEVHIRTETTGNGVSVTSIKGFIQVEATKTFSCYDLTIDNATVNAALHASKLDKDVFFKNLIIKGAGTTVSILTDESQGTWGDNSLFIDGLTLDAGTVRIEAGNVHICNITGKNNSIVEQISGNLYLDDVSTLQRVIHTSGKMHLTDIRQVGRSVNTSAVFSTSSVATDLLQMNNVNTWINDTEQSYVQKTGTCPYAVHGLTLNRTKLDVLPLADAKKDFISWDAFIGVTHTGNVLGTPKTLREALKLIDDALALRLTTISNTNVGVAIIKNGNTAKGIIAGDSTDLATVKSGIVVKNDSSSNAVSILNDGVITLGGLKGEVSIAGSDGVKVSMSQATNSIAISLDGALPSGGVTKLNDLDGEVKLIAGDNITFDTNTTDKSITINSTGGSNIELKNLKNTSIPDTQIGIFDGTDGLKSLIGKGVIKVTETPTNVILTAMAVKSVNGFSDDIQVVGSGATTVTTDNGVITITSAGGDAAVAAVNGLAGNINLVSEDGSVDIVADEASGKINFKVEIPEPVETGVVSLNTVKGDIELVSGDEARLAVEVSDQTISITALEDHSKQNTLTSTGDGVQVLNGDLVSSIKAGDGIYVEEDQGSIVITAIGGSAGSGDVSSVNDIKPDENGNITLSASDINAVAKDGDAMSGDLDMSDNKITGVADATNDTDAINKRSLQTAVLDQGVKGVLGNNAIIQTKRIHSTGVTPVSGDLVEGQLFINTADLTLFSKDSLGNIVQFGVTRKDISTVGFSGEFSDLKNIPGPFQEYELPVSTPAVLGGIKIGKGFDSSADGLVDAKVWSVKGEKGSVKTGDVVITKLDLGLDILDGNNKIKLENLPDSIFGETSFISSWDAANNVPVIPAADATNKGKYYLVSHAGTTNIDGNTEWTVGDKVISDGVKWDRIAVITSDVLSVNGMTGDVELNANNLPNLSEVAKTGKYSDLIDIPLTFTPAEHTQSIDTITGAAVVAKTGKYSDLIGLPPDTTVFEVSGSFSSDTTLLKPVTYIFSREVKFGSNFVGSFAFATLKSGTVGFVAMKRISGTTTTTVGNIAISDTGVTFTSVDQETVFSSGDRLVYEWNTSNIADFAITLKGNKS